MRVPSPAQRERERGGGGGGERERERERESLFVGWLLIVPATCECISGTDLHRQLSVLPH